VRGRVERSNDYGWNNFFLQHSFLLQQTTDVMLSDGVHVFEGQDIGPQFFVDECFLMFSSSCVLRTYNQARDEGDGFSNPNFSLYVNLTQIQVSPVLNGLDQIFRVPFSANGYAYGPYTLHEIPCQLPGHPDPSMCSEPISGSGAAQLTIKYLGYPGQESYALTNVTYNFAPEPSTFLLLLTPAGIALWKRRKLA